MRWVDKCFVSIKLGGVESTAPIFLYVVNLDTSHTLPTHQFCYQLLEEVWVQGWGHHPGVYFLRLLRVPTMIAYVIQNDTERIQM